MNDIETKAREYAEQPANAKTWGIHKSALTDAFLAGASYALGNQWREFKIENNPPMFVDILILGETGDVMVNQLVFTRSKMQGQQIAWQHQVKCKVTHFMEIPEYKPKEE